MLFGILLCFYLPLLSHISDFLFMSQQNPSDLHTPVFQKFDMYLEKKSFLFFYGPKLQSSLPAPLNSKLPAKISNERKDRKFKIFNLAFNLYVLCKSADRILFCCVLMYLAEF